MRTVHVQVRFVQPILGTASADPQIHERFIASKAPDAPKLSEEVEALGAEAIEERGTTIFPKGADGTPFLWDYQLKGFMKDACGAMRQADGSKSKGIPAHKSKIDQLIFVNQRNVPLVMPEGEPIRVLQRPLRAETAMGPRVALAASEMLPVGTTCEFDVTILADKVGVKSPTHLVDALVEWFAYGRLRGIGQWRNGGYGQFVCRITDEKGHQVFDNMAAA